MKHTTEIQISAAPEVVFAALHDYKLSRRPGDFFPVGLVKIDFQVLTAETLGVGATYSWRFRLFGRPIFAFQEQVIEWEEGRRVAYRSLTGWKMVFRTVLEPNPLGTMLRTEVEFSIGAAPADWIFKPLMHWGLDRVYRRLKRKLESGGSEIAVP